MVPDGPAPSPRRTVPASGSDEICYEETICSGSIGHDGARARGLRCSRVQRRGGDDGRRADDRLGVRPFGRGDGLYDRPGFGLSHQSGDHAGRLAERTDEERRCPVVHGRADRGRSSGFRDSLGRGTRRTRGPGRDDDGGERLCGRKSSSGTGRRDVLYVRVRAGGARCDRCGGPAISPDWSSV